MNTHRTSHRQGAAYRPLAGIAAVFVVAAAFALPPTHPTASAAEPAARSSRPAAPKPERLPAPRSPEEAVKAGLDLLLREQHQDGGWGQGGGWRQSGAGGGRTEGANVEDPSDLGNTCLSLIALQRAGSTPASGPHSAAAAKAFEYICGQIEAADQDSLYVTPVRDTQLQMKIGTYVDTFLSGWALSELKGHVAGEAQETRRAAALQKVLAKIEKHQRADGSFAANSGWASVLSQGLASRALNSAARNGARVSDKALKADVAQNIAGLNARTGRFDAPTAPGAEPSSAGISLYRESSKLGGLWQKSQSNATLRLEAEKKIADAKTPAAEKEKARAEIQAMQQEDAATAAAQKALASRLSDRSFTAGFGNNGGEEFLSYLNVGESLAGSGSKEWSEWKVEMQKTLCAAQNADGSWAGQHCITGRTFCTSAALLTLLLDRAPAPVKLSSTTEPPSPAPVAAK